MQTTHAESALIAYIVAAHPKGVTIKTLESGMPDFDVSPSDTRVAIKSIRARGYIFRFGPFYKLTDAGQEALSDDIAQLAA